VKFSFLKRAKIRTTELDQTLSPSDVNELMFEERRMYLADASCQKSKKNFLKDVYQWTGPPKHALLAEAQHILYMQFERQ